MDIFSGLNTNNPNINVNMTGEEYIKYRTWRIREPILTKKTKKILFYGLPFYGLAIICVILSFWLDATKPTTPITYNYTEILGYSIINPLLYFLVICIGLAWLFHGFGFIIVKR